MSRPTIHKIGNYVAGGLSRAQAITLFPKRDEVDTIVTDALAADSTVTDAVTTEIAGRDIVEATNPVVSQPYRFDGDIAYARVFADGKRTAHELDTDGKPTAWAAELIDDAILARKFAVLPPGMVYAKPFADGKRTWFEIADDGGPSAWAAELIAGAIGYATPTRGRVVIGEPDGVSAVPLARLSSGEALATFHSALASRHDSPVDILCIGDSITEGYGATTFATRWVDVLRDDLRARYPVSGVTGGRGYIAANYYTPPQSGDVFTAVGGELYPSMLFGLGRRSQRMWQAGDTLTATLPCTSFDLLHRTGTTHGTVTVTIDGGAPVSVSFAGTSGEGVWNSGALGAGDHTIQIEWASGGDTFVEGVMLYDGDEDAGIRVWESGFGGAKSGWYTGAYWHEPIATIQPDLVTIEVGTNDWFYNTGVVSGSYGSFPPSVVRSNIETIIANVRANTATDPSIVLIAVHGRTDGSGWLNRWREYVAMYHEIAAADPKVTVLDVPSLVGPAPVTDPAILYTDNIHLSDAGNSYYADALMGLIASGEA